MAKTAAAAGLDADTVRQLLAVPPDEKMGDYAVPCFTLAKQLRQSPAQIAGQIAARLAAEVAASDNLATVTATGPYVNFTVDRGRFLRHVLDEVAARGEAYGSQQQGAGRTLVIDFSSPNLAKPFSIAHLRSTAIGHAIYRIHQFLGWRCVGINHLGDYGANFGQLLAAYRMWADAERVEANPVAELSDLYIRFNEERRERPELQDEARACLRRLAEGDSEMVRLWEYFIAEGRKEAERIYAILGVHFDEYLGESHFAGQLDEVVSLFDERGLAEVSEGALIVRLQGDEGEEIAPCMLRTSNGTSTYHSRDLAALLYRYRHYGFDKMVYVTDMRQMLHFQQVFQALSLAGMEWAGRCEHAPFGMLSFRGEAMATRKGNVILLEDVLDRAIALTEGIIAEKNPDLPRREEVSRQVGISAVIFADVSNRRTRDISFDLEEMLNFDGETGPYVQYTHARLCSILRRYGRPVDGAAEVSGLGHDAEMRVARQLSQFPEQVESAAKGNEPSFIASYLIDLATVANKFYNEVPVLSGGDGAETAARVRLVDGIRAVLRRGLWLLGMDAPEEM
ncbi:MAG: arginine--tRNA ligase [Gemmatimonadota bacterium]